MRIVIVTIAMLALSACAPTTEQLANADYGPYPSEYQEAVKAYAAMRLKDPYSAKYRFVRAPEKGWARTSHGNQFGWLVCAWVNAKNSFGGYTGEKPWQLLIRDNRVVEQVYLSNNFGYRICTES